jgi:hypothetical protein
MTLGSALLASCLQLGSGDLLVELFVKRFSRTRWGLKIISGSNPKPLNLGRETFQHFLLRAIESKGLLHRLFSLDLQNRSMDFGMERLVKTSGSKGLQLFVPLNTPFYFSSRSGLGPVR